MTARYDFIVVGGGIASVILITGSGLKDTSIFLSDSTRGQSRMQPHHAPAPLAEALP